MIDDFLEENEEFGNYPDPEMMGMSEEEEIMEEMELMGYDVEEISQAELMGGPFARLFRKIRDRVRARRKARAERKASASLPPEQPYTITTPRGSLTTSPTGIAFSRAAQGQQQMTVPQTGNPLAMIQQNPLLLAIPAGLILFMVMSRPRGGGGGYRRRRR